jgi:predicted transcriptional regulator
MLSRRVAVRKVSFSVSVSPGLRDAVDDLAARLRMTRTELVAFALTEILNVNNAILEAAE